jgi:hypothetical protein
VACAAKRLADTDLFAAIVAIGSVVVRVAHNERSYKLMRIEVEIAGTARRLAPKRFRSARTLCILIRRIERSRNKGGGAMAIVGRVVGTAAGAEMLTTTGARPATRGRTSPSTKRAFVVAVALLALAVLLSASEAPNAEHYSSSSSAGSSTADKSGAAGAPVSQPAAPQMSEEEALDAYEKLPLSFVPNEGQTDEAVRYYAQGAGYGFFFTQGGATLSFAEGKGRGHALALDFLGANPAATLEAQKRLSGKVNYLVGDDPTKWHQGLPTHGELLYGGLWPGIDMAVRGQEGGKLKYEFRLQPGSSVEDIRLAYRGAEGLSVGTGGSFWCGPLLGY